MLEVTLRCSLSGYLNRYTNQTEKDDIKMRKYMTKEVTSTIVKLAKVVVAPNGLPVVEQLEPLVILGTISNEKAQKQVNKDYGLGVTIFGMDEVTHTYKMKVTDFIKIAELVTENDDSLEEEEEDEELPEPTPEPTPKRGRVTIVPKSE